MKLVGQITLGIVGAAVVLFVGSAFISGAVDVSGCVKDGLTKTQCDTRLGLRR
jgi:hypothetical protein